MRKLAVVILVMLSGSLINGQTKSGPAVRNDVAQARKDPFPREKFDPQRNAKADVDAAVITAKASNKRIILDIGGEWCIWCVYMDKFFYQHPELAKVRDDNFVWVKINFSPENENKEFLATFPDPPKGYPHLYVSDQDGKLLYSKDTSELEEPHAYSLTRFTAFLEEWSPKRAASQSSLP
ncbi:MAG: thioredoxin family protein [Acidobacteriota bacterium]